MFPRVSADLTTVLSLPEIVNHYFCGRLTVAESALAAPARAGTVTTFNAEGPRTEWYCGLVAMFPVQLAGAGEKALWLIETTINLISDKRESCCNSQSQSLYEIVKIQFEIK